MTAPTPLPDTCDRYTPLAGDGERRYYVETWDSELQAFTPHKGVPSGPYTKWGLRAAIRALRALGYPCDYGGLTGAGDPSVSIYED